MVESVTLMLKHLLFQFILNIKMNKQANIKEEDIPKILSTHLPQFSNKKVSFDKRLGMTNETYKASAQGTRTVIFRVLSPIIDRKYENAVLKQLQVQNICPKTLYSCLQYRIEEFIDNVQHPPSLKINKNPELMKKIVVKLHEMHKVKLSKDLQKSFLDQVIFTQKSYNKYKGLSCLEAGKQQKFMKLKQILLKQFDNLHKDIQSHFKNRRNSFRLCHNDANSGNIFLQKTGSQQILLIDFEYACYNYVSYDIANFLNQCCFEYNQTYPGFRNFKKVTSQDIRRACDFYPGKYEGIEQDVHYMLMVCNYAWGLWSLEAMPTQTFSAIEHGETRLQLFKYYAKANSKL